jgi:hypothetical protein
VVEGNIAEILKRECENGLKGFKIDKNLASYVTRGQSNFRYAVEQNIRLQQEAL